MRSNRALIESGDQVGGSNPVDLSCFVSLGPWECRTHAIRFCLTNVSESGCDGVPDVTAHEPDVPRRRRIIRPDVLCELRGSRRKRKANEANEANPIPQGRRKDGAEKE
jgi:hypothetical protein